MYFDVVYSKRSRGTQYKQKGFTPILILVGLLVLVLIGAGSYYLGKSQVLKPQSQSSIVTSQAPQPTMTPQTTLTPSAVSDETANWKIYTSKHGYSIKYPVDMKINETLEFDVQLENKDLLLTIGVFGLGLDKNLDNYVRYGLCLSTPFHETINGQLAYRSETRYSTENICEDGVYVIKANLIADFQGKAWNQDGVTLYKQILSTFQITR